MSIGGPGPLALLLRRPCYPYIIILNETTNKTQFVDANRQGVERVRGSSIWKGHFSGEVAYIIAD